MLADGDLRATFVPGAGMIGCSLRHRGDELLVQRGGLDAWRGTGRSFGLPLLHPWANRLRDWRYAAAGRAVTIDRALGVVRADANGLPIHGALARRRGLGRHRRRRGRGRRAARRGARLRPPRRPLRRVPVSRTGSSSRSGSAGDTLEIVTTVVPTGDEPVPIAFGWHPWLSLPGVQRARLGARPAGAGAARARRPQPADRRARGRGRRPLAARRPRARRPLRRRGGRALRAPRRRARDRRRVGAAATATRRSSRRRTSTPARSSR